MMSKTHLKKIMKSSYTFTETEKEKAFIKANEQRSMQLCSIVLNELNFMCRKSIPSFGALFFALLIASKQDSAAVMWYASSVLPLFALLFTAMTKRSERFGMLELEAACRFSLRFVRSVRMFILGICSLILICMCILFIQHSQRSVLEITLCFVALPYLVNVFGCLYITRKHHLNDDILICTASTIASCLIPTAINVLKTNNLFNSRLAIALTLIITAMTVRESLLFIQEGENMKWNLC